MSQSSCRVPNPVFLPLCHQIPRTLCCCPARPQFATAEEKFKFEALADADKERYEKELEAYVPPTEEELMARKEADEQERKQKRKDNSVFSRPVKVLRLDFERAAAPGGAEIQVNGPLLGPTIVVCACAGVSSPRPACGLRDYQAM